MLILELNSNFGGLNARMIESRSDLWKRFHALEKKQAEEKEEGLPEFWQMMLCLTAIRSHFWMCFLDLMSSNQVFVEYMLLCRWLPWYQRFHSSGCLRSTKGEELFPFTEEPLQALTKLLLLKFMPSLRWVHFSKVLISAISVILRRIMQSLVGWNLKSMEFWLGFCQAFWRYNPASTSFWTWRFLTMKKLLKQNLLAELQFKMPSLFPQIESDFCFCSGLYVGFCLLKDFTAKGYEALYSQPSYNIGWNCQLLGLAFFHHVSTCRHWSLLGKRSQCQSSSSKWCRHWFRSDTLRQHQIKCKQLFSLMLNPFRRDS